MRLKINFFNENISYLIRKKGDLRNWILKTIESEGKIAGDLNLILVDDSYLTDLNIKYMNHNTLTDVLTFPLNDNNEFVAGDIFISIPRIKENAKKFHQKIEDEMHRVMIHGVLHLLGYDDSSEQKKSKMSNKEDYYLAILKAKN